MNLVGEDGVVSGVEAGDAILAARESRPDLASDPHLPDDTRLWAALQDVSGGTWGGCVYDTEEILRVLAAGKKALADKQLVSVAVTVRYFAVVWRFSSDKPQFLNRGKEPPVTPPSAPPS